MGVCRCCFSREEPMLGPLISCKHCSPVDPQIHTHFVAINIDAYQKFIIYHLARMCTCKSYVKGDPIALLHLSKMESKSWGGMLHARHNTYNYLTNIIHSL